MSDGRIRSNVELGLKVKIEPKSQQGTGHLVEGVIKEILTPGLSHPHGIMVVLENGFKGRVKQIANKDGQFDMNIVNNDYLVTNATLQIPKYEDVHNEFKSTFQYDLEEEKLRISGKIVAANGRLSQEKQIKDELKKEIAITIAAFANKEGGGVYIGVQDNCEVLGLEKDLNFYGSKDKLSRAITDSLKTYLKNLAYVATLHMSFHDINTKLICFIKIPPSHEPIYVYDKNNQEAYVRLDGRSEKFGTQDFLKYSKIRFPN